MASKEASAGKADRASAAPQQAPPLPAAPLPLEPRRPLFARLAGLAVVAAVFVVAWLGSAHLHEQDSHSEKDGEARETEVKHPAKSAAASGNPLELLSRGDLAMRQYRFAQALSFYEELRSASPEHVPLIEYRLALCDESIGQTGKAIAGYRAALAGPYTPPLLFACHLGLARCLFRQGKFVDARRLLYPFLLDESRQQGVPPQFVADTRYLIALALSRDNAAGPDAKTEYDDPLSTSSVGLETPCYLDEVTTIVRPAAEHGKAEPPPAAAAKTESIPPPVAGKAELIPVPVAGKAKLAAPPPASKEAPAAAAHADGNVGPRKNLVVRKRTANHPVIVVQDINMQRPALELLDLLATESGTIIQLSAGARMSLHDRSLKLDTHNWLLDDLLEPVAEYFDLIFWTDGDVRHLATPAEVEAKQLKELQRDRAGRALRGVLLTQASHPLAAAACLELGDWESAQNKLPEAAGWLERLVRDTPNSPYAAPAHFNLALLHLRKLDHRAARIAFFRVVDNAPGHELALKAYVRIGQSYLEEDEPREGITHLKHALATAPNSPYHGHAVVALAAGYLLDNQPDKARQVLAKERTLLQKDPARATAAFLDAYAQLQLAKESSAGRREATDLLSTLWRDEDKTVLGPLGHYLIAQAYRDLGFWSHAEKLLRQAGKQAHGTLEKAVDYSLADTLLKQQHRKEAERLFVKVATSTSSYRARARLQIAQLRLQDKQYKECAALCRQLWTDRGQLDAAELLRVWGAALEGMEDFAAAARCFAGKPPD